MYSVMDKKQQLMKRFSVMLKNRVMGKESKEGPREVLLENLSRKDLIEILSRKSGGSIPEDWNIAELEKEELLDKVGDEMFVLAYFVEFWCAELQSQNATRKDYGKAKIQEQAKSE